MRKTYTRLPLEAPNPASKNETSIWVPLLQIRAGWNHKQTPRIPAVVDSGSQCCLLRSDVGEYLGIDVKRGIEDMMGGLTHGMKEPVFYHKLKLYIEADWIIDVTVGFIKKLSVAAILGRNGFFDNFIVRFDHSHNPPIFEIERILKVQ